MPTCHRNWVTQANRTFTFQIVDSENLLSCSGSRLETGGMDLNTSYTCAKLKSGLQWVLEGGKSYVLTVAIVPEDNTKPIRIVVRAGVDGQDEETCDRMGAGVIGTWTIDVE